MNHSTKRTGRAAARLLSMIFLTTLVFACATTSGPAPGAGPAAGPAESPTPMFYGQGSGGSSVEAMNNAKKIAVRKAAEQLIGIAPSMAKKGELDTLFNGIGDFNPYVVRGSQKELASGKDGDSYFYHLGVRVDLKAVGGLLMNNMILGGQIDGRTGVAYKLADEAAPPVEAKPEPAAASGDSGAVPAAPPAENPMEEASPEDLAFIEQYMGNLTYMVYFDEAKVSDPFLTRAAVISANRYLDSNGFQYVDLNQVEKLKKEQSYVYEDQTGSEVSFLQDIANRLNANVYVQVSLDANGSTRDGKYYGSATITLNAYDSSTGEGRGAATYQTNPPAFSQVSVEDALNNAVASAVFKAMPHVIDEVKAETAKALTRGFRYNLVMLNTYDARVMRNFQKKLERKVKSVKRVSYSPEETVYEVYMLGEVMDLWDLVYDVSESLPELMDMTEVMQRGNSLTFDTGM